MGKRKSQALAEGEATPKKSKNTAKLEESPAKEEQQARVFDRDDQKKHLCPIAYPVASDKLSEKLLQLVTKTVADSRKNIMYGVKAVVKHIRKGGTGIVVFGGDADPYDVISHVPVFCEQKDVPYIYVMSCFELGQAAMVKRSMCAVCILECPANAKSFAKIKEKLSTIETTNPEL